MGCDERYMNKDFQYLPKYGFTKMFENMLDHQNISVELGVDALERINFDENSKRVFYNGEPLKLLVFTGPIDELLGSKYGELPYRSLDIKYEWQNEQRIYPESIISFPQADGYTRKTEYKFLMYDNSEVRGSTVATEYPTAYVKNGHNAPFYPVITDENRARYEKYRMEIESYKNIFLCGRLAEFKYYNMDDCIIRAFSVFNEIKQYLFK